MLVRFTAAFLFTTLSEWAFYIAALVYAFDRSGARATGFSSLALLVPIALAAPAAGKAAQHRRPDRVRLAAYSVQTVALASATILAYAHAPVAVVVGCCGLASGAFTFLGPASAVLLPTIVRTAQELTIANVWINSCESVSTLAGSALATLLLAAQGPALVLAASAGLNLVSTLLSASLARGAGGLLPAELKSAASIGAARLVFRSIRALRERPGASGVLASAGGQYVLVGSLDLIVVVLANDKLKLGDSGPGLLATAIGVGAVVSAFVSTLLVRRARLAPVLIAALGGITIATLALGLAPALPTALILLPLAGFSRALVDLTSRMLLQRATPPHAVASIFGAIELFAGVGMLLGSAISQLLIAVGGVDVALIGLGIFFAVLLLLTLRSLRVADEIADIPIVAIGLLRRIPTFAALPPLALETVARAATEVTVEAGTTVMTEGDAGDQFYAVADGSFDVVVGGHLVRTVERGDGFGEIALLANVPRTATITTRTGGSLLAIQREPFLVAVTGSEASRRAALGTVRRFGVELDMGVAD
ncbi:MAG: hypothetical protein QOE00_860 [Ilumatobacteraceae bacterium]